jgi:hypothetical protein
MEKTARQLLLSTYFNESIIRTVKLKALQYHFHKNAATGITERYPDCRLDHHGRADNSEIILLNDDNILCYTFSNLRV